MNNKTNKNFSASTVSKQDDVVYLAEPLSFTWATGLGERVSQQLELAKYHRWCVHHTIGNDGVHALVFFLTKSSRG